MVFSRLLLATVDSKSYIFGSKRDDKLFVNADPGEIALCFQIDDDERNVSTIIDLKADSRRCDGLVFYAKDGEENKVICLVEMKTTNIDTVAKQIQDTKEHIKQILSRECGSHYSKLFSRIRWKAGFYCYGSSDSKRKEIMSELKKSGFDDVEFFSRSKNDMTSFLRGGINAKDISKKLKGKR